MVKITKVYTRGGDLGKTSLVGGQRVSKASVRLEAYGTVDELNSHLGILVSMLPADSAEKELIIRIQTCLFNVCTNLATDQELNDLSPSALLPDGEIERLEHQIDNLTCTLPQINGFILPGGVLAAAQAHVCRTVCRRAERRVVALSEVTEITPSILQYVNRLSDYLFVLAKKINFNANHSEIVWQNVGR